MHVKRVIGPSGRVLSIAVVAPGHKPGCVGERGKLWCVQCVDPMWRWLQQC